MGSFSSYLENKILNHIFDGTAYSAPATIYIALSTADPTEDGSGIAEPSGNNYARVSTTSSTWTTSTAGTLNNGSNIIFPTASGSWSTITHWAAYDASTSGNMLAYGALTTPKAVTTNDAAVFVAGDLVVTLD